MSAKSRPKQQAQAAARASSTYTPKPLPTGYVPLSQPKPGPGWIKLAGLGWAPPEQVIRDVPKGMTPREYYNRPAESDKGLGEGGFAVGQLLMGGQGTRLVTNPMLQAMRPFNPTLRGRTGGRPSLTLKGRTSRFVK